MYAKVMTSLNCLTLLAFITIISSSCSKPCAVLPSPVDTSTNTKPDTSFVNQDTSTINIFIGGDTVIEGYMYAAYWKNRVLKQIPAGIESRIWSICADGNDVYTGVFGTTELRAISYWKNQVGLIGTDSFRTTGISKAMTFADGAVHATGAQEQEPHVEQSTFYRKDNGRVEFLVPLTPPVGHKSTGNSIAVDNHNVYIAGLLDLKAVYWKNGEITTLKVDSEYTYHRSLATGVCVSKGDVYVCGSLYTPGGEGIIPNEFSIATYWKNNEPHYLSVGLGTSANAIAVVGDDVYVVGSIMRKGGYQQAVYWKNGEMFVLNSGESIANAIAFYGSDVYIAGDLGHDNAVYWKNGTLVALGKGNANAIFITRK